MIPRVVQPAVLRRDGIETLRDLGPGSEMMVVPGQVVEPGDVLGRTKSGTRVIRLPLDEGEAAAAMILKRPGEVLRRGEPLLRKPSLFGLACTEYVSPVDGFVEEILLAQRALVIREHTAEVRAGVWGEVTGVRPGMAVALRFNGTSVRFFAGWGPPASGELQAESDLAVSSSAGRAIKEQHRGTVLWARTGVCTEALLEGVRVGAAGILAGSLSPDDLERAVADVRRRSGRERLPLTLMISEGFGTAQMHDALRRTLRAVVGRMVYLDPGLAGSPAWGKDPEVTFSEQPEGRSEGPAGAARALDAAPHAREEDRRRPVSLRPLPGMAVRLVDLDFFGAAARIVAVPGRRRLETGVACEVATVELEDGRVVDVPLVNLELSAGDRS